jgi:hypothetical protein
MAVASARTFRFSAMKSSQLARPGSFEEFSKGSRRRCFDRVPAVSRLGGLARSGRARSVAAPSPVPTVCRRVPKLSLCFGSTRHPEVRAVGFDRTAQRTISRGRLERPGAVTGGPSGIAPGRRRATNLQRLHNSYRRRCRLGRKEGARRRLCAALVALVTRPRQ